MIISLFGGSQPDEETYALAYELGKRIAQKGYTLKNGGNNGTMEASAKGCVENGGTVIGVGMRNSTVPSLRLKNSHSTQYIDFEKYNERVAEMMNADRMIVLPGQIGTMEELFTAWVEAIVYNHPPVVIMGPRNKELLEFLIAKDFIKPEHAQHLQYASSIDEIDFLK